MPAIAVVEDVEAAGALPLVEPGIAQARHPVAAEIERRRQQHQAVDAGRAFSATCTATNAPRLEPISTRPARRQRLDGLADLLDHPGDRERGEIRLVQIRRLQLDPASRSLPAKIGGLGRPRRRREAVQVE